MDRWHMSRAGIFNFWYYDEEEFHFEEGRLILRGTNGSGKSVTMQSLIPLVLDGDKRPQRLDPFGSRDRRLEYYLLGDGNEGHTDRTGYLWLEFYHPAKKYIKRLGLDLEPGVVLHRLVSGVFCLKITEELVKIFICMITIYG